MPSANGGRKFYGFTQATCHTDTHTPTYTSTHIIPHRITAKHKQKEHLKNKRQFYDQNSNNDFVTAILLPSVWSRTYISWPTQSWRQENKVVPTQLINLLNMLALSGERRAVLRAASSMHSQTTGTRILFPIPLATSSSWGHLSASTAWFMGSTSSGKGTETAGAKSRASGLFLKMDLHWRENDKKRELGLSREWQCTSSSKNFSWGKGKAFL